ncbi:tRNA pseudouridine(38-40) synthase TruA [Rhodocytophaga aerolata]|uniref:tRNA pseudouridine synthase A n=1 Tax=Rhodocytophaga aerolata TaxID=455078 RepID=A0ABT8RCB6_9BACT|nr:tRNA pseudouridine(38-40) synthase TruA [Rhodocytophaga aerolata]MDO1448868.1 tRNA pseudouridine(38-40) synthase TruA [Rhodocytophaga aerolata]
MRYFIELAYRGTRYHGWQIQANALSVQEAFNKGLSTLLKEEVTTIGSGRTDTGVHALQQYVHFDTEKVLLPHPHIYQLNALLPPDIVVKQLFSVSGKAHARFDAIARSYEYRISTCKNPFLTDMCYLYTKSLDVSQMNEAASILLRHTDFESFSLVKTDVSHFKCQIYKAWWEVSGEKVIFYIQANRFLRGMVRAIVGTLMDVGLGKLSIQEFEEIIQSKDRRKAGRAVPPQGLFLTQVQYNGPIENL